jgi:hypothetical protein
MQAPIPKAMAAIINVLKIGVRFMLFKAKRK